MKYAWIDSMRDSYPLETLCRTLAVSTSGYHDWKRREPSARAKANDRLLVDIRAIHAETGEAYGSPRIWRVLHERGHRVGRERVRRLMQRHGIVARHRRRRYVRTTIADPKATPAPNLLAQNFTCDVPDRIWLGDITYVPTDEGWLYVAAMKDLCTKKIVGWAMRETLDAGLAVDALSMAVTRQTPLPGLVVHTDRGCQYTSHAFTDALGAIKAVQSMSGTGNAYDNAPMESFFASLKGEKLDHEHYRTRAEARRAVFTYIEAFYNPVRMHSSIGYRSPTRYEAMLRAG